MERFLSVIVLTILTMTTTAQEPYKTYCEIIDTGNITGTKVEIEIDFGRKTKQAAPNTRFLVDENGEKVNFNSMINVVNYLAKLGWELILACPATLIQGMSKDPIYHYILCKKVISDEQIEEGINLKDKQNVNCNA